MDERSQGGTFVRGMKSGRRCRSMLDVVERTVFHCRAEVNLERVGMMAVSVEPLRRAAAFFVPNHSAQSGHLIPTHS